VNLLVDILALLIWNDRDFQLLLHDLEMEAAYPLISQSADD